MKHIKVFEQFLMGGDKFIWMAFPSDGNGYSAGVVTKEQADQLESLFEFGESLPLENNVYVYVDLEQTEMRPETSDFDIEGLSFVSDDGQDNADDEPDENKLVIQLPQQGIIVTNPDGYSWNAQVLSVEEFIEQFNEDNE